MSPNRCTDGETAGGVAAGGPRLSGMTAPAGRMP
jgi:hypothetical protein